MRGLDHLTKFRLVIEVEGEMPYQWEGIIERTGKGDTLGKELHKVVQTFMNDYHGKELYRVKEGGTYV